ncbi:MAG: 30S ribosomal protein S8, partial [Candidatus Margulisbacteria bacterium]|nr:30S ribosomal protein S8 [Candidatus Margulisiibacteriota bacterium]
MTDPIADMLLRIRNAQMIAGETVDIPHSKLKEEIAKVFVAEGYVAKSEVLKKMEKKFLRLTFKKGLKSCLKRISKPGRRVYKDSRSMPQVQRGFGSAIVSTSKG